jgi:hypothetical protein
MENVSCIKQKKRYSVEIPARPYLQDHHLEGKAILPAVETLIILAGIVRKNFPQVNIQCLNNVSFPRFLLIPQEADSIAVFIDIRECDNNVVAASLLTSLKSKTGSISRVVEHARVEFGGTGNGQCAAYPFRDPDKLEGNCINIPAASVYRELVQFGPAYQNIIGDLSICAEGVLAYLAGGSAEADEELIGSPFPFDALLHAACVWGQRFTDIVPFPVGFDRRIIYSPTKKGHTYLGRILPLKKKQDVLLFDAWIFDEEGAVCELISGIQMRDISQGRLRPPAWIKEK